MSKEIYNSGRVVGMSAYELYVREHIAQNPEIPPATEREWLASTIAYGSSMLLYVAPDNIEKEHYRDFLLPRHSKLGGANALIASWFLGAGERGETANDGQGSYWAKEVTDFGPLIDNGNKGRYPGPGVVDYDGEIPTQDHLDGTTKMNELTKDQIKQLKDYILLADGNILQPGDWKRNPSPPPTMDLEPDLRQAPRLRFFFADKVESGFWVILTGFTLRSVLAGVAGIESSVNSLSPQDGDFLGPSIFPWASKVIFTMPAAAARYLIRVNYFRSITGGYGVTNIDSKVMEMERQPIVDMETTNPGTFYSNPSNYASVFKVNNEGDPRADLNVKKFSTMMEGLAVLTIYNKKTKYPPAIWGTIVDEDTNQTYLNPIDVVAPGTVKMFGDGAGAQDLKDYQNTYPGTTSMKKDKNGQIWILNQNGEMVPAARLNIQNLVYKYGPNGTSTGTGKVVKAEAGDKYAMLLSLAPDLNRDPYTIGSKLTSTYTTHLEPSTLLTTGDANYSSTGNIEWGTLIQCLVDNQGYDVLGSLLKYLRASLASNYIQFPNQNSNQTSRDAGNRTGLRLYISSTEPQNNPSNPIPIGSIGIGW